MRAALVGTGGGCIAFTVPPVADCVWPCAAGPRKHLSLVWAVQWPVGFYVPCEGMAKAPNSLEEMT